MLWIQHDFYCWSPPRFLLQCLHFRNLNLGPLGGSLRMPENVSYIVACPQAVFTNTWIRRSWKLQSSPGEALSTPGRREKLCGEIFFLHARVKDEEFAKGQNWVCLSFLHLICLLERYSKICNGEGGKWLFLFFKSHFDILGARVCSL